LFASNAEITGAITATEGKIGGWTVSEKGLTRGTKGSDTYIFLGNSGKKDDETTLGENAINGHYSTVFAAGKNFTVNSAGTLWATAANIAGDITADTGYIGGTNGWVIATNKIYSGSNNSSSTGSGDITLSTTNF
jgi:hypothetical protein